MSTMMLKLVTKLLMLMLQLQLKLKKLTMKSLTLELTLILKLLNTRKVLIPKKLFKPLETLSSTAIKTNPILMLYHQLQFQSLKSTKTKLSHGLATRKISLTKPSRMVQALLKLKSAKTLIYNITHLL